MRASPQMAARIRRDLLLWGALHQRAGLGRARTDPLSHGARRLGRIFDAPPPRFPRGLMATTDSRVSLRARPEHDLRARRRRFQSGAPATAGAASESTAAGALGPSTASLGSDGSGTDGLAGAERGRARTSKRTPIRRQRPAPPPQQKLGPQRSPPTSPPRRVRPA